MNRIVTFSSTVALSSRAWEGTNVYLARPSLGLIIILEKKEMIMTSCLYYNVLHTPLVWPYTDLIPETCVRNFPHMVKT